MSEKRVAWVGEVEFAVPLAFLAAYAALLLVLRFLASFLWSDDSGWLSSLFSFVSTAFTGAAIFTLGYFSYRFVMPSRSKSARKKKRAQRGPGSAGRPQTPPPVLEPMEGQEFTSDELCMFEAMESVQTQLGGLKEEFAKLSPNVKEETKARVVQFVAFLHSVQSPWAEEERQKSAEEKAKLLELLCDTDPFATLKKTKTTKKETPEAEAEVQATTEAELQTKTEPEPELEPNTQTETKLETQRETEAELETQKETETEERQTPREEEATGAEENSGAAEAEAERERASAAAEDLSALLASAHAGAASASALGFDLSGLEAYAETVAETQTETETETKMQTEVESNREAEAEAEPERETQAETEVEVETEAEAEPTQSSAADDLMAALMGASTAPEAPYEFGSEFAALTDLGALTKSLGVSAESETGEREPERSEGDSDRHTTAASAAAEEEEEVDEWAALEEEFGGEKTAATPPSPSPSPSPAVSAAASAKEDLLGALGSLDSGGEGPGGFSLGDVDLSALSAFATTNESSFDTSGVDLSALDGLYDLDSTATADTTEAESLSALSALADFGEESEAPAEAKTLSYDDFFSAIQCKKEESAPVACVEVPEATAGQVIRAFGAKEDMNLSGMKRSKKKAVRWGPAGKGKPVYQMEDTHYAGFPFEGKASAALFGVFDGHVGKNAAERARVLFAEEFARNLRGHSGSAADVGPVLRRSFLSTDAKMVEFDMEGATATAVYVWRAPDGARRLQAANVGDSTAFLCRNGKAVWLTVDHKVNDPEERDRLIREGMHLSEGQSRINGLAVSRALGDHFVKEHYPVTAEPFVSEPFELGEGDDKLIVASDGLWDIVSGQEALEIIKDMTDPAAMAAKLTETAVKSRLCNDNVTVIVVLL